MIASSISRISVTLVAVLLTSPLILTPTFAAGTTPLKLGFVCKKVGLHQKDSKGLEFVCAKSGNKLLWARARTNTNNQNGNNDQNTQTSSFALGALGSACSKNGLVAWNGQMTATCKGGKVAYTLASDVPPTPTGEI